MSASISFANPGIQTPVLTSVTPTGGAAGAQGYKIVGIDREGNPTAASAAVSTSVGPTTLDVSHYNTLLWTDPTNAVSVDVYRTTGGAAQGKIGRVAAGVGTLVDNGLVADGTTAPAANATGTPRGAADPIIGSGFLPGRTVIVYVNGQYAGVQASGLVKYGQLDKQVFMPDSSKIKNAGTVPVQANDGTNIALSATSTVTLT